MWTWIWSNQRWGTMQKKAWNKENGEILKYIAILWQAGNESECEKYVIDKYKNSEIKNC
jgi:hypothetical protein